MGIMIETTHIHLPWLCVSSEKEQVPKENGLSAKRGYIHTLLFLKHRFYELTMTLSIVLYKHLRKYKYAIRAHLLYRSIIAMDRYNDRVVPMI